ncbi:SDR family oxidoreductase [Niveispirillum irakense]|uniref:SDR family oxidoreductase n=1 Tax=Niveispirillum irakense TaxID=34011 RepID=UPI0004916B40|nr:SDR family oxidoreductase [Niveispirillum irakense]
MRVFITGATGWVGRAVVAELLDYGHQVLGLARSADKAARLGQRGAAVLHGTLDDLDLLQGAVRETDATIHLAFNHDFSRFAENAAQDRRAIEAMGEVLKGTDKPFLVTSGMAMIAPGRLAVEGDAPLSGPSYPRRSELAARELAALGVRAATVRLAASVHGVGETHGFVPILINLARKTGVSAYIDEGLNRWPAVHVGDAARLYRLALEKEGLAATYHAIGEEAVPFRDIAEAIGCKLGLPVLSRGREHFGWFAEFAGADMPGSSAQTRQGLGWQPMGPDLLADIANRDYYGGF